MAHMQAYLCFGIAFFSFLLHFISSICFYRLTNHKGISIFCSLVSGLISLIALGTAAHSQPVRSNTRIFFHILVGIISINHSFMCPYFFKSYPLAKSTAFLLLCCIFNVLRGLAVNRLQSKFSSQERLQWHQDVIDLEALFLKSKFGNKPFTKMQVIDSISFSNRKLNPKAYFCRLCDDEHMNVLADDFELLDILISGYKLSELSLIGFDSNILKLRADINCSKELIDYNRYIILCEEIELNDRPNEPTSFYNDIASQDDTHSFDSIPLLNVIKSDLDWLKQRGMIDSVSDPRISLKQYMKLRLLNRLRLTGFVTKHSIRARLDNSGSPQLFNMLSKDFDESLNFRRFEDNMRQVNNDRSNFLSTLRNSQNIVEIANGSLVFLQCFILIILYLCIFSQYSLFYKIITTFFLFFFPVFWKEIDSFFYIVISHPYDIGDRVLVGGDNLIVRDIGLISTTFERWNNELVVISNRQIKRKIVKNIRRSKSQQWRIEFYLSAKTDPHLLDKFIKHLVAYVDGNPAFEHVTVAVDEIKDCSFLKIVFIIRHSINHQNGFYMWQIQNKFMAKLVEECNKRKIIYIKPAWQVV